MEQNPFESPKHVPSIREAEHRSFRLTRGDDEPVLNLFADDLSVSKLVGVALAQQLPFLLLSALLLDGGRFTQIVSGSMLVFWGVLAAILIAGGSRRDGGWASLFTWLGFLPILICAIALVS